MDHVLVPGRACGGCTVCCAQPRIDAPELQKLAGTTCVHCVPAGCGIYQARPEVCRNYFCGYRLLDWIDDSLRPDAAGVLLHITEDGQGRAHNFLVTSEAALDNPAVVQAMCLSIDRGIPTLLMVNGRGGRDSLTRLLNGVLDGVEPDSRAATLERALREFYDLLSILVMIDSGPVKPFRHPALPGR